MGTPRTIALGRINFWGMAIAFFSLVLTHADFDIIAIIGFFGFCYAMYGGYKGRNPYREKRLAIFVNRF
jgi:hypothetical protein